MLVDKKSNMASRQEAKLRHAHIFAARAFQAILTVWGVLDDFFDAKQTFSNRRNEV